MDKEQNDKLFEITITVKDDIGNEYLKCVMMGKEQLCNKFLQYQLQFCTSFKFLKNFNLQIDFEEIETEPADETKNTERDWFREGLGLHK